MLVDPCKSMPRSCSFCICKYDTLANHGPILLERHLFIKVVCQQIHAIVAKTKAYMTYITQMLALDPSATQTVHQTYSTPLVLARS